MSTKLRALAWVIILIRMTSCGNLMYLVSLILSVKISKWDWCHKRSVWWGLWRGRGTWKSTWKDQKIEPELNTVSIYLNHHSCGPYAIGYFMIRSLNVGWHIAILREAKVCTMNMTAKKKQQLDYINWLVQNMIFSTIDTN